MTRRHRLLGSILCAALALLLAACGDSSSGGGGTFDQSDFPFTFDYPDGFQVTDDVTVDREVGGGGGGPDAQAAVELDSDNLILVQAYTLKTAIDASNLDALAQQLAGSLDQISPGTTLKPTRVAGLLALTGEISQVPSVENGQSKLTFFFDGDQEYEINCQSTPDHRSDVDAACDQALSTLKLKNG